MKIVTKRIPPGCKLWDCGYLAWFEPEAPGQPGVPLSAATPASNSLLADVKIESGGQ